MLKKQQEAMIEAEGNIDRLRDYKAPHANRPTPPRPHYSRFSRTIPAIKHP